MKRALAAGLVIVAAVVAALALLIPSRQAPVARAISLALQPPQLAAPSASVLEVPEDLTQASVALSRALYDAAPAVVVTTAQSMDAGAVGAGLPLLVVDAQPSQAQLRDVTEELTRLGAAGVIMDGVSTDLPTVERPVKSATPVTFAVAPSQETAVLARAYGAQLLSAGDPRGDSQSIAALSEDPDAPVIAFGDSDPDLAWQVQTARTGTALPTGTQLAVPAVYVALYGHPGTPSLGMLGEQDVSQTIARADAMAQAYRPLVDQTVIPALEIIATVASAEAGDDGNYSRETPADLLWPLVDAAKEAGQYVVLDLQPGRTDFLTQAKEYQELLEQPHVGLALDPEWRLEADQVHLRQIGHVEIDEVNQVVEWLADLTRAHQLPQKLLILHAFSTTMLPDIDALDTSRSELAVVVHVDGQGSHGAKQGTWAALRAYAENVPYWGWKNFVDEDTPAMLTPSETVAEVSPQPTFISYQ